MQKAQSRGRIVTACCRFNVKLFSPVDIGMLPGIGISEMVVIGIIAILLFGSKLPEVARNIGRSYGELRKGLTELKSTINAEIDDAERSNARRETKRIAAQSDVISDDLDEPTAPRLNPPGNNL